MRREGRQRGWVRAYDCDLVDPEGKRRAVHAVEEPAAVANGGFVRAPRKSTNHSKPTGGGGACMELAGKGRSKFKHDELKTHYLEAADDAVNGRWSDDAYDIWIS